MKLTDPNSSNPPRRLTLAAAVGARLRAGSMLLVAALMVVPLLSQLRAQAQAQDIVISEFLASNVDGLRDADGDASDWIEVRNRSIETLSLDGFYLTDNLAAPRKWAFPAVELEGGARLLVFASGKNRRVAGSELHTNFQLAAAGEYLALSDRNGVAQSAFNPFPGQFDDVSFGVGVVIQRGMQLGLGAPCRWLVPSEKTDGWADRDFDDSGWADALGGVGYDLVSQSEDGSYLPLVGEGGNVLAAMRGINATCYIRFPFEIADPAPIERLILGMKFDDGFVAYLNGVEVARDLAPNVPKFASEAILPRAPEAGVFEWKDFDLSSQRGLLVAGENVLAFQGLNYDGTLSSDFIVLPRIVLEQPDPDTPEIEGFFTEPTPGQANAEAWQGIVRDTRFSERRGFFEDAFDLVIETATPEAQIWTTTNGSVPAPGNGDLYAGPIRIDRTTVLRAAAFRDGFAPTNIDTQTYIFAGDVGSQKEMASAIVNPNADEIVAAIESLPVVSLAVAPGDFFGQNGIYSNPELDGRGAEVAVSMEYFAIDDPDAFQVDAGARIHGGNARDHPKKPLRLYFRSEYGPKRLQFPLFAGSEVDSFDQLILRGGGHDSWSLADSFGTRDEDIPPHASFLRDQFLRKTENEIGLLSPKGKYVNVFINGRYWGFYDLHERPNAAYMESYLGGSEEDYDVLHHPTFDGEDHTIVDGEATAWDDLQDIASRGLTTTQSYRELQRYVDIDSLCDHLIVRIWSGDYDWCAPVYLPDEDGSVDAFRSKNWYAGRRSRNGEGPFHFFAWDAEMSMGLHLLRNLGFQWVFAEQRVIDFDMTRVSDFGSPCAIYDALRQNAEFRLRFADRFQKHLFSNGALTVERARARLESMAAEIEPAVLAESARWGDEGGLQLKREQHWESEIEWLLEEFIPKRGQIVRNQFRAIGLYPAVSAPALSQFGGEVDAGHVLTMTLPEGGSIYYTMDGSDPYVPAVVDTIEIIGEGAEVMALVPSAANGGADPGLEWRGIAGPENIAAWMTGIAGVGYDRQTMYLPYLETDLGDEMDGINSTAFLRFHFEIGAEFNFEAITELSLQMRYDDGFVAYINGVEVASANAPDPLAWNSFANRTNADTRAIQFEPFDITEHKDLIAPGRNVLAVHMLNAAAISSDALLEPKLSVISESSPGRLSGNARLYEQPIVINQDVAIKSRVVVDGVWSALDDSRFVVGRIPSATSLAISQLHYRPLPAQAGAELDSEWGRSDFEFVEVINTADGPVQMEGVAFTDGIKFAFPNVILQPRGRAIVVANEAAFRARYGDSLANFIQIAGEFSGKLNNGGEQLRLVSSGGGVIAGFRFEDGGEWPAAADGMGYALALADPFSNPDPALAGSWIRSIDIHGSPGAAFSLTFAQWRQFYFAGAVPPLNALSDENDDPDNDGSSNALEFAFGTDPLIADGEIGLVRAELDFGDDDDGSLRARIAFRARPEVSGVRYAAQASVDLKVWSSSEAVGGPILDQVTEMGDGSRRLRFSDGVPVGGDTSGSGRYMRAGATLTADPE